MTTRTLNAILHVTQRLDSIQEFVESSIEYGEAHPTRQKSIFECATIENIITTREKSPPSASEEGIRPC